MATFPQKPGAGAAAPAVPKGWRELWAVDWTAETTHDLDTGGDGDYSDASGLTTWSLDDDTILGEANAASIDVTNGTGLVVVTGATGEISFAQVLSDCMGDYTLDDVDRLFVAVDVDTSVLVNNTDFFYVTIGDRAFNQSSIRAQRYYASAGAIDGFGIGKYTSGVQLTANTTGVTSDAFGLAFSDQSARAYHRATWAAPLTGWTTHTPRAAWNGDPNSQTTQPEPTDADFWLAWRMGRGTGVDVTFTIRRMALYGWTPGWAGN
jgi:hypothetical protein